MDPWSMNFRFCEALSQKIQGIGWRSDDLTYTALAGDQSHVRQLTTAYNPISRGSNASGLYGYRQDGQTDTHTNTHKHIHIHTSHPHTKIKKKIKMTRDCWGMQQGESVWLASVSQALSSISSDRKRTVSGQNLRVAVEQNSSGFGDSLSPSHLGT